jgi:hypothetical protein
MHDNRRNGEGLGLQNQRQEQDIPPHAAARMVAVPKIEGLHKRLQDRENLE